LAGPFSAVTDGTTNPYGNAIHCGFSQNTSFTIGELEASTILPWAQMYKYVRVKRIHCKYVHKRVMTVLGESGNTTKSDGTVLVNAAAWFAPGRDVQDPATSIGRAYQPSQHQWRRGGDMVWMCTKYTGPVPEEEITNTQLVSGDWKRHVGYSLIRKNPQLRRRAVFRNDVSFGMRPVKFSFTPTMAVAKSAPSETALLGTGPLNEQQGLIAPSDSFTTWARNPASSIGYRYKKAGWMPMVMPHFSAASSNTGQGGGYGTGSSPLVVLSSTNASWTDQVERWTKAPLFGMYMGLMPGTAEVWPRNLLEQVSFELEFKGLRNFETLDEDGLPLAYHKDWGLLPTARMY